MQWFSRRSRRPLAAVAVAAVVAAAGLSTAPAAHALNPPPAPNLKNASGGPTAGQMTIRWGTAPVFASVSSYRASVSLNGVTWSAPTTVASGSQSSAAIACPAARTTGSACAFRIYAVNAAGVSNPSNVVLGSWAAPTKPQNVRADAGPAAGKATINYAAPANNGGVAIDQYRYEFSTDGVTWTLGSAVGGPSGTLVVPWCGGGQSTCMFRLRAHNAIGLSLPSAASTATFDVPAAVQSLTSSATSYNLGTGDATVTINWGAPDSNGLGVDDYAMQFCPGFGACEDVDPFWDTATIVNVGAVLQRTMTCPVDATTCAYRIRAHNALGWGPWRHQFLQPYEPRNIDAITGSLPGAVDLQWAAPLDGGAGSLDYQVYRCRTSCGTHANWTLLNGTANFTEPGNALAATDTQCGEGTSCTYRVAVVDGAGNASLLTTTRTASGSLFASPPGNLSATTGATQVGRVDLAWTSSTAPSGRPVTGYQITRSADGGAPEVIATIVGTSYADLTCGAAVTCAYVVQAVNSTGVGAGALAAAIGAGPPDAPQSVAATAGDTLGGVKVSWAAPDNDGGHTVTSYTLERTAPVAATVGSTSGLLLADPGCGAGTSCTYVVTATNSIGTSTSSSSASATGTSLPGAPTSLAVGDSTTKGGVALSWVAPSSNGGRPLLGYSIERFNGSTFVWDQVGISSANTPSPHFTDVTCGPGNLCLYRVRAANIAGSGSPSTQASGTGAIQSVIAHLSKSAVNVQGAQTPVPGDFTGDGKTDILWYVPGTGADTLFVAVGSGNFVTGHAININGTFTPLVGDFDGDGKDDIFWYGPGTARDALWLSNGDGTFTNGPTATVNGTFRPLVADYDGDGVSDIFWYAPGSGGDAVWLFDSSGGHHTGPAVAVSGTFQAFAGDFNGDGKGDVFWYAPGTASDALWLGNGGGRFRNGPSPSVNGTFTPLVGDYDGDHLTDVFWYGSGTAPDGLWLASGGGTFLRSPTLTINGVYRGVVGDFDGNTKSDIDWFSPTTADTLWSFV